MDFHKSYRVQKQPITAKNLTITKIPGLFEDIALHVHEPNRYSCF